MIGRRKFFSRAARHIEGLPDGYTAVEYIQSSGTQYIDTGRKLTQDSDITIDFSIVGEIYRDAGIFGSRQSALKNNLTLFFNILNCDKSGQVSVFVYDWQFFLTGFCQNLFCFL